MILYVFHEENFVELNLEEFFNQNWENEESLDDFLVRLKFSDAPDKIGGFLNVYHRENAYGGIEYFIDLTEGFKGHFFFAKNVIQLIKLLKFIGINYSEELSLNNKFSRILSRHEIPPYDLDEYISFVPMPNDEIFLQSFKPIYSLGEIIENRRKLKLKKKENERLLEEKTKSESPSQ